MSVTPDFCGQWTGDQPLAPEFTEVARKVYADHPEWLPEESAQIDFLFGRNNPYFSYGRVWVGFRAGQARLAGFYDPRVEIDGCQCAYFGFWETQNINDINQSLFEEFEKWAKEQGVTRIYGPINFNTYGLYRIRTSHFNAPCFQGEPYNPEYYPSLLVSLGYSVAHQYYSQFEHDMPRMLSDMEESYARSLKKMDDQFDLVNLTPDFWMKNLESVYQLSESVFKSNFAYTPINFEIFKSVCGTSFINKTHSESSWVALDKTNGKIAGMFLSFPSWGPLLKQGVAHPLKASEISYEKDFEKLPYPRMILAKTTGVDPAYRSKGLFTVMVYRLVKAAIASGFEHYGGVLVKEDNISLGMAVKATSLRRTYALYWKSLV